MHKMKSLSKLHDRDFRPVQFENKIQTSGERSKRSNLDVTLSHFQIKKFDLLRLYTLGDTKTAFLIPKRRDKQPRLLNVGVPPPPPGIYLSLHHAMASHFAVLEGQALLGKRLCR